MHLFSLILFKIAPLYANIVLGYLAARLLETNRDTIARLMFFMINPIIIFNGALNTKLDVAAACLPLATFLTSSILCLSFYKISKRVWNDATVNLVAFGAGTGNTGYFGLPLALLFFDDRGEGLYIMALVGMMLYENTLGYYICSKGTLPAKEGIRNLLYLPTLHAFWVGLLLNLCGMPVPALFSEFMIHIKGTYAVLGMMIIGLSLAGMRKFALDMPYLVLSLCAKYICFPLLVGILLFIDTWTFAMFTPDMRSALMLISIAPMAVNTVIFASMLKTHPEKAAGAVLISTILAILYVPLMVSYFIV